MTWQQVHDAVAAAMKLFKFTVPVEQGDLEAVRGHITNNCVPADCTVRVMAVHPRFVRVVVRDYHNQPCYDQEHIVHEAV